MMLGEPHRINPTVHVPPWTDLDIDMEMEMEMFSPLSMTALRPYMAAEVESSDSEVDSSEAYSCDQFRMFEFKVRRCARGRSHDWTECPYAHPGEKARRRDPRRFHYSGTACPDFRKGHCKRGDACEFAHGVFECWLHPARYRTQPCKDGSSCRRRVCFFAHSPDQLRLLSPPHSPPSPSPPPPQQLSRSLGDIVLSFRRLQLDKVKSLPSSTSNAVFGSPRAGFLSLPTTPTRGPTPRAASLYDLQEEAPMERVESGRGIRASMLQRLRTQNSVCPDFDWVSDLID